MQMSLKNDLKIANPSCMKRVNFLAQYRISLSKLTLLIDEWRLNES